MLKLSLPSRAGSPLKVLCLGAHCDDIEIGCGATLMTLLEQYDDVDIHWQVFTSTPARKQEAIKGAEVFCNGARNLHIEILEYRDGYLPYEGDAIKLSMEAVKKAVDPDLVFTHYRHDLHQDHRLISELSWNTFRNHLLLEYEIPKWDGDIGTPNLFVPVSEAVAAAKIKALQDVYNSQQSKKWFTDDLFHSMMRIRGMECNAPGNLAEAFYTRKTQLAF